MKKKILLTGAYGFLGTILSAKLEKNHYKVFKHGKKKSRDENFNLKDFTILKKNLDKIKPNLIINLLSLTDVDKCEKKIFEAFDLNIKVLKNFSKYLKSINYNCRLIHISTDQVYSGTGPHLENMAKPLNNYGWTKFLGELCIQEHQALILRTNFVGRSETPNRHSLTDWFIKNLKKNKKIQLYKNIFFNPLEIHYLSNLIVRIMNKKIRGTFNVGSSTGLSKASFLLKIAKNLNLNIENCATANFKAKKNTAPRPTDMVMNCKKFEKTFQIKLPNINDQILRICKSYSKII